MQRLALLSVYQEHTQTKTKQRRENQDARANDGFNEQFSVKQHRCQSNLLIKLYLMCLILFPRFNQQRSVIGLGCFILLRLSLEDNAVCACHQLTTAEGTPVFSAWETNHSIICNVTVWPLWTGAVNWQHEFIYGLAVTSGRATCVYITLTSEVFRWHLCLEWFTVITTAQ